MMQDLIDRQAAIDALKRNTFRLTFAEEQNCEGHVAWSAEAVYSEVMEGALLELPSAQPKPRTGKWLIRKFGDDGKCSVCGMYCGEYDLEGSDRYCRCCGAKMEGLEVVK